MPVGRRTTSVRRPAIEIRNRPIRPLSAVDRLRGRVTICLPNARATTGSCTYTAAGDTATISAGTLRQVIEGAAIEETGTHVLDCDGTATTKINGAVIAGAAR